MVCKKQIKYNQVVDELIVNLGFKKDVLNYVNSIFDFLKVCISESYSGLLYNKIVMQGELLSTYIFTKYF